MAQTVAQLTKRLNRKIAKQDGTQAGGLGAASGGVTDPTAAPQPSSPSVGLGAAAGIIKTPQPPSPYKEKNANVSDMVANVASEDSRLMQLARTEGLQQANSRGLLNSSIAVGTAQDSVLKKATEIGSLEAQLRNQRNLSAQESGQRMTEGEQRFGFEKALSKQDARESRRETKLVAREARQAAKQKFGFDQELLDDTQKFNRAMEKLGFRNAIDMSKQDFQEAMKLSGQEFKQTLGISKQQFKQDFRLQNEKLQTEKQLARLDSNTRKDLLAMESDMREMLADMEIGADQKQQMSAMTTSMFDQYQKSIASIMANPNLPASERQALLKSSGELIQRQIAMTQSLFEMDFDWPNSAFNPNTGKTKKQEKAAEAKAEKKAKKEAKKNPTTPTTPESPTTPGTWPTYPGR